MISRGQLRQLQRDEYKRNRTFSDRAVEKLLWLYLWPVILINKIRPFSGSYISWWIQKKA